MVDEKIQYIGDGVYAGFDGYHITIRVNDHRTLPVVVFDYHVLKALYLYAKTAFPNIKEKEQNESNISSISVPGTGDVREEEI